MGFDYLGEEQIKQAENVANYGLGLLIPAGCRRYQPPMDEVVGDIEQFLVDKACDPQYGPKHAKVQTIMGRVYGCVFIWACGYRWAKNPFAISFMSEVVVSPDEQYYLDPTDLVAQYMVSKKPDLKKLLVDSYHGNLPVVDDGLPIQIPV